MTAIFNISSTLKRLLCQAAEANDAFDASFDPDVRPADPRHGDFQANGVLAFAKRQKTNPRALAESLIKSLEGLPEWDSARYTAHIAGPGFINFTLSPLALMDWLKQFRSEADLQKGAAGEYSGKTVVVDFSSPNTAKQMHV